MFDSSKIENLAEIARFESSDERTTVVVNLVAYDEGEPQVSIVRLVPTAKDPKGFFKAIGWLTIDDALAVAKVISEFDFTKFED